MPALSETLALGLLVTVFVWMVPEGLRADERRLVQLFLARIAKGVLYGFAPPGADGMKQVAHGDLLNGLFPVCACQHQKKVPSE